MPTDRGQSSVVLLDEKKIHALLPAQFSQQVSVEVLSMIDSTSRYLQRLDNATLAAYHICVAEQQSNGRGRKVGRRWHSPFGQNLYFSCRCQLHQPQQTLSLVVGLAVIRVIKRYSGKAEIGFKWPNDMLWQGKKIAGILIESSTQGDWSDVVIGIGINVNMKGEDAAIDQPWASLSQICGHDMNRNRLTAELISELLAAVETFQQLGFEPFKPEWQHYLIAGTDQRPAEKAGEEGE